MVFDKAFNISVIFGLLAVLSINILSKELTKESIVDHKRERANKVYNQLTTAVYNAGWADEYMIMNQNLYKNNPTLEQSDNKRGMDALTNLILSFSEAGKLISQPLFCKLLNFDMQQDAILNADGTININKLMSSKEYWATKRELTGMIWKEQAAYNPSVFDTDPTAYKYTRTDCKGVEGTPAKIANS